MSRRLLLALALAHSACALNPVSGRPEFVVISAERERELGQEEEAKLLGEVGRSDHVSSRVWVAAVGARLALSSPRRDVDYRFHVIDLEVPNAFALPGGPVFVTRGLLALVRNEDELAGVLGHEIGHVAARHSVGQASAATPLNVVFGVPAAIVGSLSRPLGTLVALPGALVSGVALSAYGREQEYEADEIGAELAVKAGFRPLALAELLERLEREAALHREGPPALSFLASHPAAPDRVQRVRELAAKLDPAATPPSPADADAALARLDGLLLGPSPAHGVFLDDDFFQPALGFAWRVPKGWARESQPQAVIAADPATQGGVALVLQLVGEGEDPAAAAAAEGLPAEQLPALQRLHINGRPAAELELGSGGDAVHLTWIALAGRVYRIVGLYPLAERKTRRPVVAAAVESLRLLLPADRARIRAARLRIRTARAGETLDGLLAGSPGAWSPEEAAVANDLEAEAKIAPGTRLKLPVEEAWK